MAGNEDDATPAPRRRRRAVRRAAGPPGPPVPDSAGADPHDVQVQATPALEPGPGRDEPAAPAHAHPHIPGPGHGGHHPGREPGPHPAAGTAEPRRSGRSAREDAAERSLRSLVTTRSSQVSPIAAMRAREVALPSDADLAAAEAEVTIVRRHYVPPTALTAGRRPDRSRRRTGENGQ